MKKFLVLTLLVFAMFFFVSCASDDEDGEESSDQSNTASGDENTDTGTSSDTGSDTTDSGSSDTADSDSSDSGSDTTDTGSENPGQTTPDGCTGFSIEPNIKVYKGVHYADITGNVLGNSLYDQLTIELMSKREKYEETPKTYDLAEVSNKNYSTCTECVRVFEDIDTNNENKAARQYFQRSGSLTIEEVDDGYGIKGTLSAVLEEVTIETVDDEYGDPLPVSFPVEGGKCIEIESAFFDNVCVPNCKAEDGSDKICGDDGCGHECGNGCGTELACSADQKECVPFQCEKITLNQFTRTAMTVPSYYEFQSTLTPNIGESAQDLLAFQIYYGEKMNKVWDLAGTNLNNCQLCLLVAEDQGKRFYFQQKGTVDFSRDPDNSKDSNFFNPTDGTMNNISVKDLRLIESKINTFDNIATPVPGGKCLEITNTIFNYNN